MPHALAAAYGVAASLLLLLGRAET